MHSGHRGLCRTHASERRVQRQAGLGGEEKVMRALVGHRESQEAQAEQVTTSPSWNQEALMKKLAAKVSSLPFISFLPPRPQHLHSGPSCRLQSRASGRI